ncbi:MAG: methyltransferase domain-containing protein [Planctomycetes bacterium]|nr:methyltransferase domain-containing protein [Planctomycetota bacterium]
MSTKPDSQARSAQPDMAACIELYRCPKCRERLLSQDGSLACARCAALYPIVDGVPVLIAESQSVFRLADFTGRRDTFFAREPLLRRLVYAVLPDMSKNRVAPANYRLFSTLLFENAERPRVLILGGSILGTGMQEFRAQSQIEFIDSDVAFGPLTKLVCDAHDLPFEDGSIDGVVAQAVLEHVSDPYRVCAEIHRVLKPKGLVYAETPFLQPAHSTPYDFHRFTHIGYRRVFRSFGVIGMGPVGGPGQALGHLWEHFLSCFFTARPLRALMLVFARITGFWLKYLDGFLNKRKAAMHGAFGLFILARRNEKPLTDREVVDECRAYD